MTVDVLRRDWPWLNLPGLRYFGDDIYVTWPDISLKYDIVEYDSREDWTIFKDEYGTTKKTWRFKTASPLYLDPIVKSPQDFKEKVEPALDPADPRRASSSNYPFRHDLQKMIQERQQEFFVAVGVLGPWEYSAYLCGGLAKTLLFMMKNQDFAGYMFSRIGEFLAAACQKYLEAGVDGIWMFEDQGSQDGPFFSPNLYAKLLKPAHEKVCEPFKKSGLPRLLHSDGRLEQLIPHLLDAGFNALHPIQGKAGMQVKNLRDKYERLTLIGGIDTHVLSNGTFTEIEKEVKSKIQSAGQEGRYIVCSDGPVPPTVSMQNYTFFVKTLKKFGTYPLKI